VVRPSLFSTPTASPSVYCWWLQALGRNVSCQWLPS